MDFKKSLTLYGSIATSLSCMIGSGWLFSSFISLKYAGPAAILSWVIGGFLIILIALTFAELGTMFPTSGGISRYAHLTYGTTTSFLISWLAWISSVSAAPTEVQATIIYLSHYFPELAQLQLIDPTLSALGIITSGLLLLIFTIINLIGINYVARLNNILVLWKVFVPLITCIILVSYHHDFNNLNPTSGFAPNGIQGIFMAVSTTIVFSYLGFREVTSLGDEIINPQRTIPYAVVGSVLFAMVFYVFIQTCFILSIPSDFLNNSWSSNDIHITSPVLDLTIILGFSLLAKLIYIDAIITPSSTALIFITTSSRLNYAVSSNHQAPKFLSKLNQYGVPYNAIISNFFVGALLLSFFPNWKTLVQFQTTAILFAYIMGPLSLITFRKLYPNVKRPFKLPMYHIVAFFAFYSCTILIYWTGWNVVSLIGFVILIGLGFLYLYRSSCDKKNLPKNHYKNSLWVIYYLLGLCIISYNGTYGGNNYIQMGYDMFYLLIHSLITIYFAIRSSLEDQESKIQSNICHTLVDA